MKGYSGCSLLHHSALMLWRNRKSYAMLSVTIVLSFSLLLGYLAFTDSKLYNQYKHLFSLDPNVVLAYRSSDNLVEDEMIMMERRAAAIDPNAQIYHYYVSSTELTQYGSGIKSMLIFIPVGDYIMYGRGMAWGERYGGYNYCEEMVPIYGCSSFNSLKPDEAIINQSLYEAVRNGRELPFKLVVPIESKEYGATAKTYTVNVVGVCADSGGDAGVSIDEYGDPHCYASIYLSQAIIKDISSDINMHTWYTCITSEMSHTMLNLFRDDYVIHNVAEQQDQALEAMRIQTGTKGMIAIALLLLLGINLYSSFANALNDRKFEIGVKRAIGAPGRAIVTQFLIESVLVMLINILISIALVTDGSILYKLYEETVMQYNWVTYISGYSIVMFALCSISLTIVFSLLFAYRSTQVEVVAQLKAE